MLLTTGTQTPFLTHTHTHTHTNTHLFNDPHMEVVEVRVAAIGLPAVLTAVMAASEHGDGVQRVGLTVVVAHPCSTPEARETSVSYGARKYIQNGNGRCGDEGRKRRTAK